MSIRFRRQTGKLASNELGSIKIMVALATPFLLLVTGAAVDTAELYRARINLQNAVDAGALMAAKTLTATGSSSQGAAAGEELFYGNIRNIAVEITDANISFDMGGGNCASQPVVATATLRKRVFFAFIRAATTDLSVGTGRPSIIDGRKQATEDQRMVTMQASAEVMCGGNTIEVAMVLDNSGSMGSSSKMGTLISSSTQFVNTIFTTATDQGVPDSVKFALIPFSAMVNVGADNENASWMDTSGVGTYHHQYLDWESDPDAVKVGNSYRSSSGVPLTRFTLFDNLPGISWKGCVESRPYPEHTRDTTPDTARPETVFVPTFSPDTPDNWTGEYEQNLVAPTDQETCTLFQSEYHSNGKPRNKRECELWSDGHTGYKHPQDQKYLPYWDDGIQYRLGEYIGSADESQIWKDGSKISEEKYYNNYLEDDHNFPSSLGHPKSASNTGSGENQYKRQRWTWKYFSKPNPRDVNGNKPSLPVIARLQGGPNIFCTSQELTSLTANKSDVLQGLSQMVGEGSTNIQAGVAWGWRALSPGLPFTEGRPYSVVDNKKVMVVMTDGNNTAYPITNSSYSKMNKSYYNTWSFSESERIFDGFDAIAHPSHDYSTFRNAMDEHLVETCNNAKAAGISIYSIAFNVSNGSSVKEMLEQCASTNVAGDKQYFDATNNSELAETFEEIAGQLAKLTVTK